MRIVNIIDALNIPNRWGPIKYYNKAGRVFLGPLFRCGVGLSGYVYTKAQPTFLKESLSVPVKTALRKTFKKENH